MYRRRLSLACTLLVGATLLAPAMAAETIPFTKQDHQVDTAIALQMQEADGSTKRYFFTLSGELGQMVMCKATFKSHLSRIMQALRANKEFKYRKVLGAECARTKTKPIAIYP